MREEIGAAAPPYLEKVIGEALAVIRTQLDEAAFAEAWEEGRTLTVDEAVALALGEAERDA